METTSMISWNPVTGFNPSVVEVRPKSHLRTSSGTDAYFAQIGRGVSEENTRVAGAAILALQKENAFYHDAAIAQLTQTRVPVTFPLTRYTQLPSGHGSSYDSTLEPRCGVRI
jgi:hypothetical protein